jgi:hypothetical protein
VARFKRLSDAEARTLTRAELLDRVEAEEAYWERKQARGMTAADDEAAQEFSRIMHAYLSPHDAIQAAMDTVQGRGSDYWERRPCDELEAGPLALDDNQRAGLEYGLALIERERGAEAGQ